MPMTMVFVHVPKSAGTSAIAALSKLFPPEVTRGYYDALPKTFQGLSLVGSHANFVDLDEIDGGKLYVTAIRRPIDRLRSIYRFWKSIRIEECVANGRTHLIENKQRTFEEFLLASGPGTSVLDNETVRQFARVAPESGCTSDDLELAKRNISRCASILRTEHLDHDLRDLFVKIGCERLFETHRLNVTDLNHKLKPSEYEEANPVDVGDLSSEALRALHNLTYLDAQLYDYAASEAETKRNTVFDPSSLTVVRPRLPRGERLQPCGDRSFLAMLASGWTSIDPTPDNTLWSVGPEASLHFMVDTDTDGPVELFLEFNTAMVPNRKYMLVDVDYGGSTQKVLFLQNEVRIDSGAVLNMSIDQLCVAPKPARVGIKLKGGRDHVHIVTLRLPASTSSPMLLGYNHDERRLGVKLLSIELA